jgi:RNA recognition motif-containing protein
MESEEAETAAINALDGAEWKGRVMKVNKARPREEKGGRSNGNSWGKANTGGYSRRY